MRNRVPKVGRKQVERCISSEYSTLMWYKRALEDLEHLDSPRARSLEDTIRYALSIPSGDSPEKGTQGTSLCNSDQSSMPLGADNLVDDIWDGVPWYHRNVIPDAITNLLANFTILEAAVLTATFLIILAVWGIHPN